MPGYLTRKFQGLSKQQAVDKLKEFGPNKLVEKTKVSAFGILLRQLKNNFLIYLLLASGALSFILGKNITAWVILIVIFVVVLTSFIQEYRAEKALDSLKEMILPFSRVIRDGKEIKISSVEIVPEDIVILRSGEKVPADGILLLANELRSNEAVLSGESAEIKKNIAENDKPITNDNKVFMGTFIASGKAVYKVTHTGMNTEFGKIANMISTIEKEMPLQNKINKIVKLMSLIAVLSSVIVAVILLYRAPEINSTTVIEVSIVMIALMVSAFPEGFPVVLTSTLASGIYQMAKKNAIVNRMSVIETFGETTVICSDKTGTITKGQMTAKQIYLAKGLFNVEGTGYQNNGKITFGDAQIDSNDYPDLRVLIKSAVICNDARIEEEEPNEEYKVIGSPTEASLLVLGAKANVFENDFDYERIEEIPFSSSRKMMSVLSKEKEGVFVYSKGALEVLINKCKYLIDNGQKVVLTTEKKTEILAENMKMTSTGLRTIAAAYKESEDDYKIEDLENDLSLIGFIGIEDPPREEVSESIKIAALAGIKVKMITGDNKETALSIAKQIGIQGNIVDGEQIDQMSDSELAAVVQTTVIFARVRPEHKLRIVQALKSNGEIVTMTGDGVNDAPALKEANIGVAMGENGTDVTKEVADLTLKDDNFSTLVSAISEGRTIFSNIRKFSVYQLSCNLSEIILVFISIIANLPLPLIALQILFINLITDDLPAISLGFNPSSKDVMQVKPRKNSNILTKNLILLLVMIGLFMGIVSFAVYYTSVHILNYSQEIARTNTFLILILIQIANAFGFRSLRAKMNEIPLTSNKYLIYASLLSIIATIIVIYTPINIIFEVVPIHPAKWFIFAILALSVVVFFDALKGYSKKSGKFLAEIS